MLENDSTPFADSTIASFTAVIVASVKLRRSIIFCHLGLFKSTLSNFWKQHRIFLFQKDG